jgi:hypothetical protein
MPMPGSGSPQVIFASCDTEEEAKRYMEARSRLNGGVFPHRLTQEVGWWCVLGGTSPPDLRRDEEDEEEEEADRKRALINEWDDTRENYEPEEED